LVHSDLQIKKIWISKSVNLFSNRYVNSTTNVSLTTNNDKAINLTNMTTLQ